MVGPLGERGWFISIFLIIVVLFSESKTEEKALEKEGYVYDFYYPNDNYGRLGDM